VSEKPNVYISKLKIRNSTHSEIAKILATLIAYAKQFSQNIGHEFTDRTILLTALTGAAATEIAGRTAASVYAYLRKQEYAKKEDIEFFKDTRLSVIDEISFASYNQVLGGISKKLKAFTECHENIYGKHGICFLGDFCQLEAIGKDLIYENRNGIYWEQSLNCMVELKGTHRFNNCDDMKRIMPSIRDGVLSSDDRKILNSRVINGKDVKKPNPLKTKYATFFNAKRAEINASVFRNYLKTYHKTNPNSEIPDTAIVVKTTTQWSKSKLPLTFDQRKILFEQCSEADVKRNTSQMCAPQLCLFSGCNLMLTENEDVLKGKANGTTCLFRKLILKPGARAEKIQMYGYWVNSISIEDVEFMVLRWEDCDHFAGNFQLKPKVGTFRVKYPICEFGLNTRIQTSIELQYLSVIVNHATTGHKLQGKTVVSLVIAQWSKVKNWAYVVLSRVKTLDGLFLMKPIPEDIDFAPAADYLDMMAHLRTTILATPEQVSGLKETLNPNQN
jgi:hypothetical protein